MVSKKDYDCCGWATKANVKCSDGRTIMPDSVKDNDGQIVPLVWNHDHTSVDAVLGHALLENKGNGVFTFVKFNDTETGQNAKKLVEHGDITAFSIFANQLKEAGKNVMHGNIREVSLVLAGANPGASIQPLLSHGEFSEEEAVIYSGEEFELFHSDEPEKKEKGDQKMADENKEKTIADIVDSMTEEQKNVLYALVGNALDGNENNDEGDDNEMKHNVFDNDPEMEDGGVLTHADEMEIMKLAKQPGVGSLWQIGSSPAIG